MLPLCPDKKVPIPASTPQQAGGEVEEKKVASSKLFTSSLGKLSLREVVQSKII